MDKKYLKQIALYALTTVISVGLMLYIGYHLFYGLTQKVETRAARISAVAEVVDADMYIFRDETPVRRSGTGGSLIPAVADGARVGVGDTVSRLYDVSSPDIVARIDELELQLSLIREMERLQLSVRDTAAVDGEIYDLLSQIAQAGVSGECAGVPALRASLTASLNRRAWLIGTLSDAASAAGRLRAERDELTARLGACRAQIVTDRSGYYYADCDGYEASFTASAAMSMTPEQFASLTAAEAADTAGTAGKIASGYTWYAACISGAEAAASLTVGRSYEVSFPYGGGQPLRMTLSRSEEYEGGVMLVFSCSQLPADFAFTRSQPATIRCREYSGIQLPLSALRAVDGVPGVYILEGGIVRYRAVSVIAEGEDWFMAEPAPEADAPDGTEWLARNDIVITRGRGLYEGRVLS